MIIRTLIGPTTAEVAFALDGAADHIERVGHHRGHPYDPGKVDGGMKREDVPVSADAALRIAVYGTYITPVTVTADQVDLVFAAEKAFEDHVADRIDRWSDAKGRQKRTVVKALRDTAASLREAS